MIKIENIEVVGFEHALRGMRNPMNSWNKSDSDFHAGYNHLQIKVGEKDLKLAKQLSKAGTDHSKYLRMITVYMDITAPLYWIAEHDTYKVGTVRNSCSFMHKGISKPFDVNDFSIQDDRVYYLLNDIVKKDTLLKYKHTDNYRIYELDNGRKFKIFENSKIIMLPFEYTDTKGRHRKFDEKEIIPSQTRNGYFEVRFGGRNGGEHWLLHRLIASIFIPNDNNEETVNHIDGDKGNNDISNLEWVSRSYNSKHSHSIGINKEHQLHRAYKAWKSGHINITPFEKSNIIREYNGKNILELVEKYNLTKKQMENVIHGNKSKNLELFNLTYMWENTIENLNTLRNEYLETRDEQVFQMIRQLLPQGYNQKYTWSANYEVLKNIYHARKNHRLAEWKDFCKAIEELPYFKEMCIKE